jgi:hypothetical protein
VTAAPPLAAGAPDEPDGATCAEIVVVTSCRLRPSRRAVAITANTPNAATALPAAAEVRARPRGWGGRRARGVGGVELMTRPIAAPAITAMTVQTPNI